MIQELVDHDLIDLGIALGIGLLIGMEREWADDSPVGLRSFALIGLLGGVLGLLGQSTGGWPVALGLVALAALLMLKLKEHEGLTTGIAALVVFALGAAAASDLRLESIVAAGATTSLLHWKATLHGWVDRLGKDDLEIIARFVLLALVILPVLPDRTFGPYEVFNPFETWLLVVLIVGINIAGYIALRLFGTGAGVWLAGVLGGLISSTATTVSYATASRRSRRFGLSATLVILLASTVIYARIGIELFVVAPGLLPHIAGPTIAFSLVLIGLCLVAFALMRRQTPNAEPPDSGNPARVQAAVTFAVIYVVILFAVAAARDRIGDEAIYVVAMISGLTDVDALTLSVGQLFSKAQTPADVAWRSIFLATLANLVFKTGVVVVLGSGELKRYMASFAIVALAAGSLILWLWT